ncbi:hypothetical protein [Cupriavidus sp. 8B]
MRWMTSERGFNIFRAPRASPAIRGGEEEPEKLSIALSVDDLYVAGEPIVLTGQRYERHRTSRGLRASVGWPALQGRRPRGKHRARQPQVQIRTRTHDLRTTTPKHKQNASLTSRKAWGIEE